MPDELVPIGKRVALRPSTAADFLELQGGPPLFRCRCLTAVVDGRVIGIGGIVHAPDGTLWASVPRLLANVKVAGRVAELRDAEK